jgi:hypothetical protein
MLLSEGWNLVDRGLLGAKDYVTRTMCIQQETYLFLRAMASLKEF